MSDKTLLFFGDSITYGASDTDNSGWVDHIKSWVLKQNEISESYYSAYNLGIPGNTSSDLLKRFQQETISRIDEGDVCTFIFGFGANDVAHIGGCSDSQIPLSVFINNTKKLIAEAKKYSEEIFMLLILPVDELLTNSRDQGKLRFNCDIESYNTALIEIADQESISIIDLNSIFKSKDYQRLLNKDGLHPNADGHDLIYQTVLEELLSKRIISAKI